MYDSIILEWIFPSFGMQTRESRLLYCTEGVGRKKPLSVLAPIQLRSPSPFLSNVKPRTIEGREPTAIHLASRSRSSRWCYWDARSPRAASALIKVNSGVPGETDGSRSERLQACNPLKSVMFDLRMEELFCNIDQLSISSCSLRGRM